MSSDEVLTLAHIVTGVFLFSERRKYLMVISQIFKYQTQHKYTKYF